MAACALVSLGAALGCAPPPQASAAAATEPRALPQLPRRLEFHDGPYEAVAASAQAQRKLVFVDAWAPWCHTCLSMRDVVLHSEELGGYASDYEFVAVDTDRPETAPFLERYRVKVWPTFFVIDPGSGAVLAMHGGAMSLTETKALLDLGLRTRSAGGSEQPGEAQLRAAHAAFASRDLARAAKLYEDAAGLVAHARRAEALLGAMRTLYELGDAPRCVAFGEAHAAGVPGSAAPADFVSYWRECVNKLLDAEAKQAARARVRDRLRQLAAAPPAGASVDDRADLLAYAAEAERDLGDLQAARLLEDTRLTLLEQAARAAPDATAAQVFDYARMNAYLALKRGDEAVAMFRERIEQLPGSYEAHARLASTLLALERPREAMPALERA